MSGGNAERKEPGRDGRATPHSRREHAYDSAGPGGPAQQAEGANVPTDYGVDVSSEEAQRVYDEERGTTYAGACSGALLYARRFIQRLHESYETSHASRLHAERCLEEAEEDRDRLMAEHRADVAAFRDRIADLQQERNLAMDSGRHARAANRALAMALNHMRGEFAYNAKTGEVWAHGDAVTQRHAIEQADAVLNDPDRANERLVAMKDALQRLHDECCTVDVGILDEGPMIAPSEQAVIEARKALRESPI